MLKKGHKDKQFRGIFIVRDLLSHEASVVVVTDLLNHLLQQDQWMNICQGKINGSIYDLRQENELVFGF